MEKTENGGRELSIDFFDKRLQEEQERLEKELAQTQSRQRESAQERMRVRSGEPADSVIFINLINNEAARTENLRKCLYEKIPRAFEKLKTGGFGICEECGELIAGEQLIRTPYRELCVLCKTQKNKKYNN